MTIINKYSTLLICVLFLSIKIYSQIDKDNFTIVFYNVENLFDTINSKGINDEDFTPDGNYNWNTEKYFEKIERISTVLYAIDSTFPDVVGLCEIENRNVLEDLVKNEVIANAEYQIVHEDSPDLRGIDVAFLYRKETFEYLFHKAIPVFYKDTEPVATRDILYVKGVVIGSADTLHFFVNHWPSRRGGAEESEFKRIAAAKTLKNSIDSLFNLNINTNIIIIGDFNDNPTNKSIRETLIASAFEKDMKAKALVNLHLDACLNGRGTFVFMNEWHLLDQIIISQNLLKKKNSTLFLENAKGEIFESDFLLFKNRMGKTSLNSTYFSGEYVGGYSDHLPVFIKLFKR